MILENYYPSPTGWLESNYIYIYCSGEYTWNGIRPSGERPTTFYLDNPLTDPSYSIDIEITNNDTENALQDIPNLTVLINGQNVRLGDICPDAYIYSTLMPEESANLTATLDTSQFMPSEIYQFGIDTGSLFGTPNDSDFSVRVISPDIFTGWMQRNNYTDIRVYDNGIWTS